MNDENGKNLPVETQVNGQNRSRRGGAPKGSQNHLKHGLSSLKKAWSKLGARAIDGRSKAAVALRTWRLHLIEDLGGKDEISTQQEALIDLACKSKFLLDSIDTWLLTQPSLVNVRKRSLLPVVLQRQALADGLARYLTQLGLSRRVKAVSINDLLAANNKDSVNAVDNSGLEQ